MGGEVRDAYPALYVANRRIADHVGVAIYEAPKASAPEVFGLYGQHGRNGTGASRRG